jgi:hypothetical protein
MCQQKGCCHNTFVGHIPERWISYLESVQVLREDHKWRPVLGRLADQNRLYLNPFAVLYIQRAMATVNPRFTYPIIKLERFANPSPCSCNNNNKHGFPHCSQFEATEVCAGCRANFCGRCLISAILNCRTCHRAYCVQHDPDTIDPSMYCPICFVARGGSMQHVDSLCMIVRGQKPDGTPNYVWPAQNFVRYK